MKMKKISMLMTAALAACAFMSASCTDKNAEPPVIQFSGSGVNKDTFDYKDSKGITGTIVAEAELKSVTMRGPNSTSATTWFKESDRFEYDNGDPIYLKSGSKDNYIIAIEPGKTVKGDFLGNVTGNTDYKLPTEFPEGKYTLVVTDKNGNPDMKDFYVVKPTLLPNCADLSNLELLGGTTTSAGATAWTLLGTDSIITTGDYFYKQDGKYGMLRVKSLNGTQAQLTLFKLNTTSLDSIATATIGTSASDASYFTNAGIAKLATAMNDDGTETFVAIRSSTNGLLITSSKMSGSFVGKTDEQKAKQAVTFLSVATVRSMAPQSGLCQ
jgi:hypothetical protein